MSLLMEALRKAEEAKRKVQLQKQEVQTHKQEAQSHKQATQTARAEAQQAPAPAQASDRSATGKETTFTLEERDQAVSSDSSRVPLAGKTSFESGLPRQPEPGTAKEPAIASRASISDLHNYFAAGPDHEDEVAVLRSHLDTARTRQQQEVAASVLAARQGPAGPRKTTAVLLLILALLLPAGGGLYWYLLNTIPAPIGIDPALADYDFSGRQLADAATASPAPIQPEPSEQAGPTPLEQLGSIEQPGPNTQPGQNEQLELNKQPELNRNNGTESVARLSSAAVPGVTENVPVSTAPGTAALATSAPALQAQSAAAPLVPVPLPSAAAAGTVDQGMEGLTLPPTRTNATLQITRSNGVRQNDPRLLSAYAQLQAGEWLVAAQLYQEVLSERPDNRDALLGLATVRLRQDDTGTARALYARLLQLNPRDALARTGILQTMQALKSDEYENELTTLLNQFPEVAPLSFALGNLYAGQQRWSEAQGAYFNALLKARRTEDPVHPDYAFNLAVSLEQLGQGAAALDYYRQAQALALTIAPGFDLESLSRRLAFLEQNQP